MKPLLLIFLLLTSCAPKFSEDELKTTSQYPVTDEFNESDKASYCASINSANCEEDFVREVQRRLSLYYSKPLVAFNVCKQNLYICKASQRMELFIRNYGEH